MSRTPAKVLMEIVDKKSYKCDQIIESSGIWAVMFEGRPFNLKSSHYIDGSEPPKYKKTSFPTPGHARNLCRKLNVQFKTDKFTVALLSNGTQVYPD